MLVRSSAIRRRGGVASAFARGGLASAFARGLASTSCRPTVGIIDMENRDGTIYTPRSLVEQIETHELDGVADVVYTGAPHIEAIDAATLESFSSVLLRRCPFGPAQLSRLPNLRHVLRMGAGYDNIDLAACAAAGVVVSNCPDAWTEEVADHTLALLLALLRQVPELAAVVAQEGWTRDARLPMLGLRRLRGMRIGLVGLGRIGTAVAQRCRPFGFDVAFYDPHKPAGAEKGLGGVRRATSFLELLSTSDVISFHCPLTDETRHLLDRSALIALPGQDTPGDGVWILNTARGGVLDEEALVEALADGRVRGAALDSLETEPTVAPALLEAAHRRGGNLILTPHAAFYSDEAFEEMRHLAAREARRVLLGEAPWYRVG